MLAPVETVTMPAELVAMPVLAPVETAWMPAELVAMPVLAPVETAWMPAELVAIPEALVTVAVEIAVAVVLSA